MKFKYKDIKIYKTPIILLFKLLTLNIILDIISIIIMIIDYFNIKKNYTHNIINLEEYIFLIILIINVVLILFLFLKYLNEYFIFTEKNILYYNGIILKKRIEINIENIGYATYKQTICGKIFGYGTIYLNIQNEKLKFRWINCPSNFIKLIK